MDNIKLNETATLLENIEVLRISNKGLPKFFDMATWAGEVCRYDPCTEKNECGTAACAVGTAAMDRWHQSRGLHLIDNNPVYLDYETQHFSWGYEACARFYGISVDQAVELFSPDSYSPFDRRNPTAVAARIREFVRANSDEPTSPC